MRKRKIITLTLTQSCNLSCSYCFEAYKSKKSMTLPLVEEILDRELNDERFDEYEIDFFGGEPLLKFDLIKEAVKYVAKTYPNKPLLFTITTNGTLVHGEMREWLKEHSDIIWCALSLDGTKRMHDLNRSDSFEKIDIDFFRDTWPTQTMKMTVSKETLPYLSEGIIFMHENGYAFTANLAFDIDWSSPENSGILERELMKLIDYYLSHPDVKPCSFFEVPIYKVALKQDEKDGFSRQCGAGVEMVSYDTDGKAYPCQFFMPLSIGEEKAKAAEKVEFPEEIKISYFDEKCRDCMALQICHTCYGSNYAATGNIFKKDENWCKLQKVIFRANAYFISKKIENDTLQCSETELPYLLKAVVMLLKDFH